MSSSTKKRLGGGARRAEIGRRKELRGSALETKLLGPPPPREDTRYDCRGSSAYKRRKMTGTRRRFLERLGLFVPAARFLGKVTTSYVP